MVKLTTGDSPNIINEDKQPNWALSMAAAIPSGILNKPEPIPAKKDPKLLTPTSLPNSLAVSFSVSLVVSDTISGNKASTWEL